MPSVTILCDEDAYYQYTSEEQLERLRGFADVEWLACQAASKPQPMVEGVNVMPLSVSSGRGPVAIHGGNHGYGAAGELIVGDGQDPVTELVRRLAGADAVVLAGLGPYLSAEVLQQLPNLRMIGDVEGDRFANRIDTDAAFAAGVTIVDTTQGTSYPVSEWALALALIALKNAGSDFRQMISGTDMTPGRGPKSRSNNTLGREDLWGKSVGLIGCGFMGRRLLQLLKPFQCRVFVFDPYLPPEAADMLGFTQTSLDNVMGMDVVISLVPQTPGTDKLIGRKEIALMKPGCAFVNVSRGAVVDTEALVERLEKGDISAGLDVFDPEPIPAGHPITLLPNVFLSPHSASRTTGGGKMVCRCSTTIHLHAAFTATSRTLSSVLPARFYTRLICNYAC